MVGMLGCGCCGTSITDPVFYGTCDCGPINSRVRKNYLTQWDEPIPDSPIFKRPNYPPYTYDKYIHSSRLHCAASNRFTFPAPPAAGFPLPYWHGYGGYYPWTGETPPPYYLALTSTIDETNFAIQFGFNEFDYEISYDFRINSGVKAALFGQNIGTGTIKLANINCEPHFSNINTTSGNGIAIGVFVDYLRIQAIGVYGPMPITGPHKIYVYENSLINLMDFWHVPPILKELQFDKTYKVKNVMTCPRLTYPNHGTLTSKWFIDDELIRQYQIETDKRGTWTQCNANYWRLLRCTTCTFLYSYVYPFAFYGQNPALNIFFDSWEFKLINK